MGKPRSTGSSSAAPPARLWQILSWRRETPPSSNMTVVQALRGFAALWVVLFHAARGHHVDSLLAALPAAISIPLFDWGHYGVAIFFALSGFVIAHSLRDARVDGAFFGAFVVRRSIRLDPPYWGAIAICILFGWVSASVKHEPFSLPSASTVAAHLVYLQNILQLPEINTVFWTLTYEVQFYLVLCGALMSATIGERYGIISARKVILALLFGLAAWSATGLWTTVLPGLFLGLWYAFFLGVLAYWSMARPMFRIPLLALVVIVALPTPRGDYGFGMFSAGTAVLLFGAGLTGWLYRGLRARVLQLLGLISYSLYLLHNPVSGATGFLVHRIVGHGVAADVTTLIAIVVASIFAAALYFYWLERPVHRWSRAIKLAKRVRNQPGRTAPLAP